MILTIMDFNDKIKILKDLAKWNEKSIWTMRPQLMFQARY